MAIAPRTVSAPRAPWAHVVPVVRIRGQRLQDLIEKLFAREPNCRTCAANGVFTVATIRDHIINLAEGGTEEDSNTQPLCVACHDSKTASEAKRGRLRNT